MLRGTDPSAQCPLRGGLGIMLVKAGNTAGAPRKGPVLPVTEAGSLPPSSRDDSKVEPGLQHKEGPGRSSVRL